MNSNENSPHTDTGTLKSSTLQLLPSENNITENTQRTATEAIKPSLSQLTPPENKKIAKIPQHTVQTLITSNLPVEELAKYFLQLPLDPKIDGLLLSNPEGLMEYLQKVPVMSEIVKINFEDALLKGPSYQAILAFLLFRFNYAFLKHKESRKKVLRCIAKIFGTSGSLRSHLFGDVNEGLRIRLIFLLNITQALLEENQDVVLETCPTIFAVSKIFTPLTGQRELTTGLMKDELGRIVNSELFQRGVENYLQYFDHEIKATEVINTCKNLVLTTFGIQSTTRILGMILPDGIGLEMNHSLNPELLEQKKAQYVVSVIHLLGLYISKIPSIKTKKNSFQYQGTFIEENNKGFLFQLIILGDLKQWWQNSSCRIKLLNVNEWPLSPPLFTNDEWSSIPKQEISATCNSSMFLTPPIDSDD